MRAIELALYREAMKEQGNNQHTSKLNNIKDAQVVGGNSKAYTCERLKRDVVIRLRRLRSSSSSYFL